MIPDSEGLHEIANTHRADRQADIVFVHGLGGTSHATWRQGKEGRDQQFFWPEELGKDLPACGIWTVGYPAGFTALGKPGMIIDKRAGNLSQKLANAGLGSRPLLFITHSMGGLVVKSLIVGSQTLADSDRKRLVGIVRGIVFCATPHRGSAFADAAGVLGKFFGGSQDHVDEMRVNAEPLDILHDQFIEWHRNHPIPVDSYAENIGLYRKRWWWRPLPLGLVVPRTSANPGIAGHTVRDVDDDHLTIVKPRDRTHDVYAGVLRFVRDALAEVSAHRVDVTPTARPPLVSAAQPAVTITGVGKPRVYLSYTWRTLDFEQKVFELAEKLRENGIDSRLDLYFAKSLHGFLPPDPLPGREAMEAWQEDDIRDADCVLVVCSKEYIESPEDSGAWRDMDFMKKNLKSEGVALRKFIPCGFGAYEVNSQFIPSFIRGAIYYDLTPGTSTLFGFEDLVRRFRTEFPPKSEAVQESLSGVELKASHRHSQSNPGLQPSAVVPRTFQADISRIDRYAPAELIGREAETKLLSDAWDKAARGDKKRPHVLTFVALGGEGKTSVVAKWAAELAHQDWPGCDAVFAWTFYHQGTDEKSADSSDVFLKQALTFFGDPELAESSEGASDKGRRLAELVGERRALLILDGLEPLQYAPTSPTPGELKDQGLAALLKALVATSHGLCVVTTRYSIPDLRAYRQTTAPETKLTRLSKAAGVALLRSLGVKGSQQEFETLVEDVKGHALTLNLLGSYLRDAHAGDIRKRDLVKLEEASDEQGGHAFRVMDAYVQSFESEGEKGKRALAVLRLLGLFDRPATADCLAALLKLPAIPNLTEPLVGMSEAQRNIVFTRLESAKLLTVNRDAAGTLHSLDAHPLLREYFARQLRTQHSEAWRAAHRRLYEHLSATTKEGDQPTLEELQPLYQAVTHGCQAGLQQEACEKVYRDRIQRGKDAYSTRKLGAVGSDLGAVACFFETPWSRVSPALAELWQAWLLNEAAFRLRALGRLTEALEPMQAAVEMAKRAAEEATEEHTRLHQSKEAAIRASNLSELELTLGEVAGAVGDAEQSVTYADRSGDPFHRGSKRETLADALHQADRRPEAEARLRQAEALQAENQPNYPLLYSTGGFRYCDLLLREAERAAWQVSCSGGLRSPEDGDAQRATLKAVSQRAAQTLKWAKDFAGAPLLDFALNHLTLGRAELYAAILEGSSLHPCRSSLQHAVDGLRRAGTQEFIVGGLLTRAWLRFLEGKHTGPESAWSDLDEAWEIAERGPMKLHMADIHLHRARLFFRESVYPWDSPQSDLAAAGKLINDCGYHRRDEELEDARKAILP